MIDFYPRLKAAMLHLALSALIGMITAAIVFGLWFPWPYRVMAGGQSLFILIVSVDLVLGPALTLVVFNRTKPRKVLARDLAVIAVLQLSALLYGMHAVFIARPVAFVFEDRRFRVLSAVDVYQPELATAAPEFNQLSITGPKLLGTRKPASAADTSDSLDLALKGFDTGTRPSFWQPYAASASDAVARSRPVSVLIDRYPGSKNDIAQRLAKIGRSASSVKFAPVISKVGNWCVLLDAGTGAPIDFVEYDGFF